MNQSGGSVMLLINKFLKENSELLSQIQEYDNELKSIENNPNILLHFRRRFTSWRLSFGNTNNVSVEEALNKITKIGGCYGVSEAGLTELGTNYFGELGMHTMMAEDRVYSFPLIHDFWSFYILLSVISYRINCWYPVTEYLLPHFRLLSSRYWEFNIYQTGVRKYKSSLKHKDITPIERAVKKINKSFKIKMYLDVFSVSLIDTLYSALKEVMGDSSIIKLLDARFSRFIKAMKLIKKAAEKTVRVISYMPHEKILWTACGTNNKYDDQFRFHSDYSPARINFSKCEYCIHNVLVPAEVITSPKSITRKQILNEQNQEVKRVMMERYGFEKLLSSGDVNIIDSKPAGAGEYRLLSFDDPNLRGRAMVFVQVLCPSTGQKYILRVPPDMESVDEAVAWTFGFEKDEYRPILEA